MGWTNANGQAVRKIKLDHPDEGLKMLCVKIKPGCGQANSARLKCRAFDPLFFSAPSHFQPHTTLNQAFNPQFLTQILL